MSWFAQKMRGRVWQYEYEYVTDDEQDAYAMLCKREKGGWEVVNITGTHSGNDVIWFKRKITKPTKPPKSPRCRHGAGNGPDGTSNCITCGPPV